MTEYFNPCTHRPDITEAIIKDMIKMYTEGKSLNKIAEHFHAYLGKPMWNMSVKKILVANNVEIRETSRRIYVRPCKRTGKWAHLK